MRKAGLLISMIKWTRTSRLSIKISLSLDAGIGRFLTKIVPSSYTFCFTKPQSPPPYRKTFLIDNLLVQIHFIIETIWWTSLAPWEFEFPFQVTFYLPSYPTPTTLQNLSPHLINPHLTQSDFQVVSRESTPTQIRQSILYIVYISNSKG